MGGAAAGKPSSGLSQIGGSGAGLGVMPGQGSGSPSSQSLSGSHNLGLPMLGGKEDGLPPQIQQLLSGLVPNQTGVTPGSNMQFGAPQTNQQFGLPSGSPGGGMNIL